MFKGAQIEIQIPKVKQAALLLIGELLLQLVLLHSLVVGCQLLVSL